MPLTKKKIEVGEDDEPLLVLSFVKPTEADPSVTEPYPLGPTAEVEFVVKANAQTEDADAIVTYTRADGEIVVRANPNNDKADLRLTTLATAAAGKKFWKCRVTESGNTITTGYGDFVVIDL